MRFDAMDIKEAVRKLLTARLPEKLQKRVYNMRSETDLPVWVDYDRHAEDWLDAHLPRIRRAYAESDTGRHEAARKLEEAQHDALRRAAKGHEVKSATLTRWVLEQVGITWQQTPDAIVYTVPGVGDVRIHKRRDALKLSLTPYDFSSDADKDKIKAMIDYIRVAAAEKIGLKISTDPNRPQRTRDYLTDFTIRTCAVCFRDIKAPTGRMVDHGFQIVGRDWNHHGGVRRGHCPGTDELAFEISPEMTKRELEATEEHYTETARMIQELKTHPPEHMAVRKRIGMAHTYESVLVARGTYEYDVQYKATISQYEGNMRQMRSGMFMSIPWLRMAIRTWKPGSPHAPAVGAPDAPLIPEDYAGL